MLCGFDRACLIQAGDPVLVITTSQVGRQMARCAAHAGCDVPETLDEVPVLPRLKVPDFAGMRTLAARFDPKLAAVGRDE